MKFKVAYILGVVVAASCARTISSSDVAAWRGSTRTDSLDRLLAIAFRTPGRFFEAGDNAFALSSDSTLRSISVDPTAVPRLVECLGWNKRAAATWMGYPVFVGVVCFHALMSTAYFEKLNVGFDWPQALQDSGWVSYRTDDLAHLRAAREWWRSQLRRVPPSYSTLPNGR
jgi:hypothetical protein